jgi:hypothetical protein
MERLATTNKAIILGRGVDEIKENGVVVDYRLSPDTTARAHAMIGYYRRHEQTFKAKDSMIVASGGYARLAGGQTPPPEDKREGKLTADMLMSYGVPHNIIETELLSGSTTENFQHTIDAGFFNGEVFSAFNPLIVVASLPHGRERGVPIARAGFGIDDHAGVGVLAAERDPLKMTMMERIGGLATNKAIADVQPQPFNADDMAAVGERFEELIGSRIHVAKLVAGFYATDGSLPILSKPSVLLAV